MQLLIPFCVTSPSPFCHVHKLFRCTFYSTYVGDFLSLLFPPDPSVFDPILFPKHSSSHNLRWLLQVGLIFRRGIVSSRLSLTVSMFPRHQSLSTHPLCVPCQSMLSLTTDQVFFIPLLEIPRGHPVLKSNNIQLITDFWPAPAPSRSFPPAGAGSSRLFPSHPPLSLNLEVHFTLFELTKMDAPKRQSSLGNS